MVDKTQEDLHLEARIAELEKAVRVLSRQIDSLHLTFDDWTVTVHRHDRLIKILDPLQTIVEHVEQIREFFESWRKGFIK